MIRDQLSKEWIWKDCVIIANDKVGNKLIIEYLNSKGKKQLKKVTRLNLKWAEEDAE